MSDIRLFRLDHGKATAIEGVASHLEKPLQTLIETNLERNQQILECVQQAPQRSILLFANSVGHATELSARLDLDNLGRFQDRHPYHYCADYFRALNADVTESVSA